MSDELDAQLKYLLVAARGNSMDQAAVRRMPLIEVLSMLEAVPK